MTKQTLSIYSDACGFNFNFFLNWQYILNMMYKIEIYFSLKKKTTFNAIVHLKDEQELFILIFETGL